jgi:hypothetical protein
MASERRPKSLIMAGVASGDMKVENTPIFMGTILPRERCVWLRLGRPPGNPR